MAKEYAMGMGPISVDCAYPLVVFRKLVGLSDWALRACRRNGLKMRIVGNRKFILGQDFHDYLNSIPNTPPVAKRKVVEVPEVELPC